MAAIAIGQYTKNRTKKLKKPTTRVEYRNYPATGYFERRAKLVILKGIFVTRGAIRGLSHRSESSKS